jgi:hypothetical protein
MLGGYLVKRAAPNLASIANAPKFHDATSVVSGGSLCASVKVRIRLLLADRALRVPTASILFASCQKYRHELARLHLDSPLGQFLCRRSVEKAVGAGDGQVRIRPARVAAALRFASPPFGGTGRC